ncbi:MAG: glycosyltransferase family 39 protein, partial [Anaerolineae bacterium]|nr:glycosyltransferase family 39 protein [Anaerolineae bacterium]
MTPSGSRAENQPAETPPATSWRAFLDAMRSTWRWLLACERRATMVWLALLIVLGVGGWLRFRGLDWDEGQHLHPDERFLTMVENSLWWPANLGEYFDTGINPLNPYNTPHGMYVYGLFPLILAKFLGQLTGFTGYSGVYLVGRAMAGGMDLITVFLIFLIGRRLYDERVGLVGAFCLAVTALNIQQSHFFTVDTTTTMFLTLALYFAVRVAQGEGWGSVIGLGLAFGMAVSAKISALTFSLVIAAAFLVRIVQLAQADPESRLVIWSRFGGLRLSVRLDADDDRARRLLPWVSPVGWAVAAGLVVFFSALVVFRLVQPQAFMGPGVFGLRINPRWAKDMAYIKQLVSGKLDYPPSHQWTARPPVWYMLKNMVLWGQGLPLGLAAWAGWGLMGWELWKRHRWVHLLPWVWVTFTFGYQSVQFVKTIRYLLPIYPAMALMAGYLVVRLFDVLARRRRAGSVGWQGWAALTAATVTLVGAVLWGVAVAGIYKRPVTRVEASRWIYEHIPLGSAISNELWDDALPLSIDGHAAGLEYRMVQMDLYWEDVPEKREQLYSWLAEVDYIALSSNRLYASIPRLPNRYPMTTRFYQALFAEELGFERVATFTSRPRVLGIPIRDDEADESWTVYDHPKVIIFRKRPDFSLEKVRSLFDDLDLERVVRAMPRDATRAPSQLMLDEATWEEQQASGTWRDIFDRDDWANRFPVVAWLLALYVLAWGTFPLAHALFRGLADRGYLLSKALGLLLFGYLAWLLPSLRVAPNSVGLMWGCAGAVVMAGAVVAYAQRDALGAFLRTRWRHLVRSELLFLALFGLSLAIRWANPDLWHPVMGGEKPMDLAYLNAILRSKWFPPYDPWFAGGYINYYYLGLAQMASAIKLTGIVPTTAYNLAVPTLFALTGTGACAVVHGLLADGDAEGGWWSRAWGYGLAGTVAVVLLGNLGQVKLLWEGWKALGATAVSDATPSALVAVARGVTGIWRWLFEGQQLAFRPEWWYWNASRIMAHGEINEFPFFTFLYGDLHAHMTALPYALLALGIMVSVVRRRSARITPAPRLTAHWLCWIRRLPWARLGECAALALVLGYLWGSNTWDLPTYAGILGVCLALTEWDRAGRLDARGLLRAGCWLALTLGVSYVLTWPYHANYGAGYTSVRLWQDARTSLSENLWIHGLFLYVLYAYVVTVARERGTRQPIVRAVRAFLRRPRRFQRLYRSLVYGQTLAYQFCWALLAALGVIWLASLLAGFGAVAMGLPLLVGALLLLVDKARGTRSRMALAMVVVGAALTVGVEFVVLQGDIGRMNTVFKFYLQAWVLWGLASALGLATIVRLRRLWSSATRGWWTAGLILLVTGAALYAPTATVGKIRDRWHADQPTGLDGAAYMETAVYHDRDTQFVLDHDRRAIVWLQDNVTGSPVIAEGNTPLYRWGGRISVYTGLPTIVGWDWHQKQQRAAVGGIVVDWRLQDVQTLYGSLDVAEKRAVLERYGVDLVYVGELERAYYAPEGLAALDAMVGDDLSIIYQDGPVTIYAVRGGDQAVTAHAVGDTLRAAWAKWGPSWISSRVAAEGPATVPESRSLMLDVPVQELLVVRDRAWNSLASASAPLAILQWWAVFAALGLAAWPLAARLFPSWGDAGYAWARIVGWLAAGYLVWIGASLRLWANVAWVAWLAVLGLGLICWLALRRGREAIAEAWARHRQLILGEELLFTVAFGAFVTLRLLNPDLWHPWYGGEKLMELAYLNAVVKSAHMPPYDPYFAHGYLNYYYYGHYLVGYVLKLTGLAPEVGFNLAIPSLFGLTCLGSWAIGRRLGGSAKAGFASLALVALVGNLTVPMQWLESLGRAGGATFFGAEIRLTDLPAIWNGLLALVRGKATLMPFDYWTRATRAIPYAISEFPFFSFLFADLHAHVIALPATLLVLALLLEITGQGLRRGGRPILWLAALALTLGSLYAANPWDLPAYGLLIAAVLAIQGARASGWRGAVEGMFLAGVTALAGYLLFLPFARSYVPIRAGLGLLPAKERTPQLNAVVVWGTHLFLTGSVLAWWGHRAVRRLPGGWWLVLAACVVVAG